MLKKTENESCSGGLVCYPSLLVKGTVAYAVLYFGLLGLCPPVYRLYLNTFFSYHDLMPSDAPKQITDAKEIFGVHNFNEALEHFGDEVVIFRNYSNCAEKFDNIIYPRRKDRIDNYVGVETIEGSQGNVYAAGTRGTDEQISKSLGDLLDEASPDYYATFLRIFDTDDYRVMLNADNETKFAHDSSFISHFKQTMVTTPTHSAPIINTFSVQCYGSKSWLFHHIRDLTKHGFIPQTNPHGVIINGSPDSIVRIPTIRAVVHAGDVLYFPPFYYHAVASTAGKNVMFAIRKASLDSFKKSFKTSATLSIFWALRYSFMQLYNKKKRKGFFFGNDYMPFKSEWLDIVVKKQKEVFQEYHGIDDFNLPTV